MRFLIVDDDFDSRRLMQKILYSYGYCDVAVDGEEAVEAFRSSLKNGEPYDLICLDIIMPNMDGQQALREIREIETEQGVADEARVKAVMISALDDTKELHDAFFLGEATSYLVKPIRKKTLLNEIRNLGLPLEEKPGLSVAAPVAPGHPIHRGHCPSCPCPPSRKSIFPAFYLAVPPVATEQRIGRTHRSRPGEPRTQGGPP